MTAQEVMQPLALLAGSKDNGNNTPVNKYFNWPVAAYCGLCIRYAFDKSGNAAALEDCPNSAYVPTLLDFCKEHWTYVPRTDTRPGDVWMYLDDHTGFVYKPLTGNTVITLEGNAQVYATVDDAERSASGTGAFEGIGYKKRVLTANYTVWRPPYGGSAINYGPDAYTTKLHLLRYGSQGPEVKLLQRILYSRYGRLKVTGYYNQETADLVRRAQEATGCAVDGECGAETWPAVLYKL